MCTGGLTGRRRAIRNKHRESQSGVGQRAPAGGSLARSLASTSTAAQSSFSHANRQADAVHGAGKTVPRGNPGRAALQAQNLSTCARNASRNSLVPWHSAVQRRVNCQLRSTLRWCGNRRSRPQYLSRPSRRVILAPSAPCCARDLCLLLVASSSPKMYSDLSERMLPDPMTQGCSSKGVCVLGLAGINNPIQLIARIANAHQCDLQIIHSVVPCASLITIGTRKNMRWSRRFRPALCCGRNILN